MTNEEYSLMRDVLDITDYDYLDIIEDIIDRIDNLEDDVSEWLWYAIDDSLIYYHDQWTVLQHFFVPQDANWQKALELLADDIMDVASAINTYRKQRRKALLHNA